MATRRNGKTYDDYYNQQTEINKAAAEKQVADITASTQKSINNYNTTVDTATENTVGQYQQRIDEAPKVYQEQYDLNAIAELVNKRQLEESMANMGLTDSGTNRSQQTALSVMRGNADAATRKQEQDYVNQLTTAIDNVYAESEANKANYANQMNTALDENIAAIWNNAQTLSAEQATSLYNQQEQNFTNEYVAQVEAERAAAKAQQDTVQQIFDNALKYSNATGVDLPTAYVALGGKLEGSGTAKKTLLDTFSLADLNEISNWKDTNNLFYGSWLGEFAEDYGGESGQQWAAKNYDARDWNRNIKSLVEKAATAIEKQYGSSAEDEKEKVIAAAVGNTLNLSVGYATEEQADVIGQVLARYFTGEYLKTALAYAGLEEDAG